MKNGKSILWGIVLIVIGFIMILNSLSIINVNLFFDGWWTFFIIIPCLIGLITDKDKTGNLIGLIVGIILLLACQKVIDFDLVWKLIIPIIIIIIGLSILFKNIISKEISKEFKNANKELGDSEDVVAVFSGQEISVENEEFKGKNLCAVFGAIDLDIRKAKIKGDVVINASAIFGGIEIIAPEDVNIVIKSSSVFGGAKNNKKVDNKDKKYSIYINASCIFGGVDIK